MSDSLTPFPDADTINSSDKRQLMQYRVKVWRWREEFVAWLLHRKELLEEINDWRREMAIDLIKELLEALGET